MSERFQVVIRKRTALESFDEKNFWLIRWVEGSYCVWLSDDIDGAVKFGSRDPVDMQEHGFCASLSNWEWV